MSISDEPHGGGNYGILHVTTLSGVDTVLKEATVAAFKQRLRGPLIASSDDGYDEARRVWNANIDGRPSLIARPAGVADVMQAVNFAREHHLLVAVRGGAHSFAGTGVCHGGLVIDLSLMKSIRVDPVRHTVRAEGGVKWGEFDRETQAFGLTTPGAPTPIPALRASPWAVASAGWGTNTGWPAITCSPSISSPPTARSGWSAIPRIPTSSGGCVAAGATLAWSPRSITVSIPSARYWQGWCCIPLRRRNKPSVLPRLLQRYPRGGDHLCGALDLP